MDILEVTIDHDPPLRLVQIQTRDSITGEWRPDLLVVRDDIGTWHFALGIGDDPDYAVGLATDRLNAIAREIRLL